MQRPQINAAAMTTPVPPTPGGTPTANYLSFVNGDWATIDKENNTTIIKSPDGKTIQRPKVMLNKNTYNNDSSTMNSNHNKEDGTSSPLKVIKPMDDSSSDDDSDDASRNTKDTGGFLSDDDLQIEIDDDDSSDDDEVKSLSKSKSFNSKFIDSSDDDDEHDFRRRPVERMTSGQLRQWDGFHNEVSTLVKIAMPNNLHQVSILLKQFDGREAELIQTLQTMCRRKESSTIPCNYKTSKQSKIHHSRGAISTETRDSIRRTSTMNGRKIDAIARIAAASTLDDQTKAVKPEYVVDENQYDHSYNNNHTHSGNHSDDDEDDDHSFWKSKVSLALSFDSNEDDDDNDDDFKHHRRHNPNDEDPSQIYSDEDDEEDDGSYEEGEADTYYDDEDDDEEDESNIFDDDDDEDASAGSSASWDEKYGNSNNNQWR